jgi:hypothetical protein
LKSSVLGEGWVEGVGCGVWGVVGVDESHGTVVSWCPGVLVAGGVLVVSWCGWCPGGVLEVS